jgi:DNA-binding PadR family transcriptional regulator
MKEAVLGLLVERRGYGYDLAQRLERRVGPGWQLNPNTIYVALDRLEEKGLVRRAVGEGGEPVVKARTKRGAPRVMYEVTNKGVDEFESWMAEPSRRAPFRQELHLKLALSQPKHLPRLIEITYEQERACLARLEEYAGALRFEELARRVEPWEAISAVMVRDAEIAYLSATVDWLRRIRETMQWLLEQPTRSLRRA